MGQRLFKAPSRHQQLFPNNWAPPPQPSDHTTPSTGPAVTPYRSLLVIGDSNNGKTWLTKRLLYELNIDSSQLRPGERDRTRECQLYTSLQPVPCTTNPRLISHFAFLDTEGLNRTDEEGQEGANGIARVDPMVSSLIHRFTGVIVYVVKNYLKPQRDFLSALVRLSRATNNVKIVVIHNRPDLPIKGYQDAKRDLCSLLEMQTSVAHNVDEILQSNNGHQITHFMLLNHRETGAMSHNEKVFSHILHKLESSDPIDLDNFRLVVDDSRRHFNLGFYETFVVSRFGEIILRARPLDNTESDPKWPEHVSIPQIQIAAIQNIAARIQEHGIANIHVVEVGGINLDISKTEFIGMYDDRPHYFEVRVTEFQYMHEPKTDTIVCWSPTIYGVFLGMYTNTNTNKSQLYFKKRS